MQQAAPLQDDQINKVYIDGVGSVTVATTRLPCGVFSAWSPADRILIIGESLSAQDRAVAISRWSAQMPYTRPVVAI